MAVLIEPDGEAKREVVLWMSHLDGSAQQTLPMLARFAAAGHPAVSFDAVGHGARSSGDPWAFAAHVLAAFRRRMGPILGQTRLEAMRAYPVLGSGADRSCRGRPGRWRVHGRRRSRRACRHRRTRAAGGHDRVHTELVAAGHAPARRCLPADRAGRSPIRTRSGSPTSSTPAGTFSDTAQGPRSPSNWVRPTITSPPRMPECSSLSPDPPMR